MKTTTESSLKNEPAVNCFFFQTLRIAIPLFLILVTRPGAQAQLGPYEQDFTRSNPFHPPLQFPSTPGPVLADLDRDGDQDLIVGATTSGASGYGVHYYENEGTATQPIFAERYSWDNPFYYVVYDPLATLSAIRPSFGDFDKDGDLDMVVGHMNQGLRYYKNVTDWTATNPVLEFEKQTTAWDFASGNGNPFLGIDYFYSVPRIADFDGDNDDDLILGTLADGGDGNYTVHLFINDGAAAFTHSHLTGVNATGTRVSPAVVDFDKDSDLDIITGDQDGVVRFFENNGSNSFTESVNWPVFDSYNLGTYVVPAFADLNNDGLAEAIMGSLPTSGIQSIMYLENKGSNVYEKRAGIHDPFGGLYISPDVTPFFSDIDQDGDEDVLLSNRNDDIFYLKNNNGTFDYAPAEENIFSGIVTANKFSLSYVDLNGDGLRDIVGGSSIGVQYFQFNGTTFTSIPVASGPFRDITIFNYPKTDFADIDNDGDPDLFLSDATDATDSYFHVRYFENTGSATEPQFTERTGTANLLNGIQEEYELYPRLADIDHDGDLDALIGEGGDVHAEVNDSNEFLFYENTGTASTPQFVYRGDLIPQFDNAAYFSPAFHDIDNDGDLDIIEGDGAGLLSLYRNNNDIPVVSMNTTPLTTDFSSGSVLVDQEISLTDADNDMVSLVTVSIDNFGSNDSFSFTTPVVDPQPVITSDYSESEGILKISGKATLAFYQELLGSLTYHFNESGFSGGRKMALDKIITIQVFDADFTTPVAATRTISISTGPNSAPVFNDSQAQVNAGGTGSLDLAPLITDAENNVDLTTLAIVTPADQGTISISGTQLSFDYTGVVYKGVEVVTVQVCDEGGFCAPASITINVLNTPPVFASSSVNIISHQASTVDLMDLVTDGESNIDVNTLTITLNPASEPETGINSAGELVLDYSNSDFTGTESMTLQVCDFGGDCAQSVITINVLTDLEVVVFNAVAPRGSSELNRYLHIENLPEDNRVSIFNRWGDLVYKTSGYSNEVTARRFEGNSDRGNALPSGTYFYKIEYEVTRVNGATESKVLTGYLSLQQ